MKHKAIKFSKSSDVDFVNTLKARVQSYFEEKHIERYGDQRMIYKTIFMFLLYLIPYGLLLSGAISSVGVVLILWAIMGLGKAGIGLAVMHDANHGAYSKNRTLNKIMGYSMNFLGGNATLWKIQHNVLHHSFTNIDGLDEDIQPAGILRFSPHSRRRKIHRFQHFYAWFFYGLMTLSWITSKEFIQLYRYRKNDRIKTFGSFNKILRGLIGWKILYYIFIFALPIIAIPVAWYWVLAGIFIMHFITGFILGIIFQPAHVMPSSEYPMPGDSGTIENNWAVHQLLTTTNFSPKSKIFSWYIGGLNYQIEHHLFPTICHIHYKKISNIVRTTAEDFGLPYHSKKTFVHALIDHQKMLFKLGHQDLQWTMATAKL